MRESAVGDVFHAESDLTTHGDALGDAQRRQSTAVSRQLIAAVAARRPQERLEIALQRHTQHLPVYTTGDCRTTTTSSELRHSSVIFQLSTREHATPCLLVTVTLTTSTLARPVL